MAFFFFVCFFKHENYRKLWFGHKIGNKEQTLSHDEDVAEMSSVLKLSSSKTDLRIVLVETKGSDRFVAEKCSSMVLQKKDK